VDKLHWVWDTGLVEHIAAELARHITDEDGAAWAKGSIEDWVMEGHRLAQTVAYGDLGRQNPPVIGPPTTKGKRSPSSRLSWRRAGVRLAYLLNTALK